MRFQSYFNTAVLLVHQYDGSVPLVHFLKQYFSQHKKHGSKDRKFISHLCYNYFRIGHALQTLTTEERMCVAVFLCNENTASWYLLFNQEWLDHWTNDLPERLAFVKKIYPSFKVEDIFPWTNELSNGIDQTAFLISHLIQPDLFLRIRPGKEKAVERKLNEAGFEFNKMGASCLALPNASKIDAVLTLDEEAVIQDYSSQRVGDFFSLISQPVMNVWDCCAASGGKSILAYDCLPEISLTVSDIRPAILRNLEKRLEKAGINRFVSFVADLGSSSQNLKIPDPRLIICDAPCSGSGTWGRTPEQLYFFSSEKIDAYASLQQKIACNALQKLTAQNYFLYITCSVFKKENEDVQEFIAEQEGMVLIQSALLKGYAHKADSMYACLFRKER